MEMQVAFMANLWTETKDPITGESSLTEHRLRVVQTWCSPENHYFDQSDDVRLATCA